MVATVPRSKCSPVEFISLFVCLFYCPSCPDFQGRKITQSPSRPGGVPFSTTGSLFPRPCSHLYKKKGLSSQAAYQRQPDLLPPSALSGLSPSGGQRVGPVTLGRFPGGRMRVLRCPGAGKGGAEGGRAPWGGGAATIT